MIIADEIVRVARTMHERGLVVGSVGNVSARDGGTFLVTPTRMEYDSLRRGDLVRVDRDGEVIGGHRTPSRETTLHAAIYRARPDVGAIVHTHSVYATAWSFRGLALAPATEEIDYYGVGEVQCTSPARAGAEQLARESVRVMGDASAVLLGAHGVVATGDCPAQALTIAEIVEHQAQIAWLLSGGKAVAHPLPSHDRRPHAASGSRGP